MTVRKMNLVVVSHPDDEILGFGATGAKLCRAGELVQPIILCGSVDARTRRPADEQLLCDMERANRIVGFQPPILGNFPNIRMNTIDHLALVQFIEEQVAAFMPHRIFTHHSSDLNDDHKQVHRACLAAARLCQRRSDIRPLETLALMEIPSSTDWAFPGGDNEGFRPNTFVEIGEFLDVKLEALGCYTDVMRAFPHPRSAEVLRGLAAVRGGQSGLGNAEAFQTIFSTCLG